MSVWANSRRIVEWGHRNLQGLARHPVLGWMVTVEHGPDRDDEINRVVFGGNFGWNPQPGGYNICELALDKVTT